MTLVMKRRSHKLLTALGVLVLGTKFATADITLDSVTVGDTGNTGDTLNPYDAGIGAVAYAYNIGKYEVTIGQYTAFLNAVAATDTYTLYNENVTDATIAGITRSGSSGNYTYSVSGSADRPVTYVNWFGAARFANWMANAQPSGAQTGTTTEDGSYTLNGATSGVNFTKNGINPNTGAATTFWIPSQNEWYKAAYFDPSPGGPNDDYWLYPTRSDSVPGNTVGTTANQANFYNGVYSVTQKSSLSGSQNYLTDGGAFSNSASFYGTYDQGGNVWEWTDAVGNSGFGYGRGLSGGSWYKFDTEVTMRSSFQGNSFGLADDSSRYIGFRLASVPEPTTAVLMLLAGAGWLVWKRRRVTL